MRLITVLLLLTATAAAQYPRPGSGGGGGGGGGGGVTQVTGTAPIVSSGGTTPAISVNAATSSTQGVVKPDNSTITVTAGTISAATATTSTLGIVKPDNSTITVTAGVLSAAASFAPAVTNAASNGTAIVHCDNATDDTALWNTLLAITGATIQTPNNCTSLTTGVSFGASGVSLVLSPGFTLKNTAGTHPVVSINQPNSTVSGSGTLDNGGFGTGTSGTAGVLYLGQFATNVFISNITIQNGGTASATNIWAGIQAFASSATQSPTGSISNVHVTTMPGLCVALGGTHSLQIIGGQFDHCNKGGIELAGTGDGTSVTSAYIHHVYDLPASGSRGASGNGIFCSGSANCNISNNVISQTEYSGVRANGSAGSSIGTNTITNSGDWGIYTEFNNANTAISGNTLIDPLGGCITNDNGTFNVFGLGNLNNNVSVTGNTCVDPQGSGTDGSFTVPLFGAGIGYTAYTNVIGNSINGAYVGILGENTAVTNSQTPSVLINDNNIFDNRPQTITYTSLSGTVTAGDQVYVGGSSWATSLKRGLVTVVSTGNTRVVVTASAGYFAASDAVVDLTSGATFTASAVAGPQLAKLTLSTQTGFNIFDTVTLGTGATQSTGMVTCVPSATLPAMNSPGCPTANQIVVSLKSNATSLQIPFAGSGTLTDVTTSSTATISGVTNTLLQQQAGIGTNTDNSGFCNEYIENNLISNFVQFAVAQSNGGSSFSALGTGICYTPIGTTPGGAVTVVGAGNLTSTDIVTGGGSQTVQTPSSGATVSSGGLITGNGVTSNGVATVNGATFNILATSAATSGANVASPLLVQAGNIWNGTVSVPDFWQWNNQYGTGTNPSSTYTLAKGSGSSGSNFVSINFATTLGSLQIGSLGFLTSYQGNGAKLQVSTGTTTTNDCVKFDANGNTVDAGSACGAGGGAQSLFTSSTSTTPAFSGTLVFSMADISTTSPVVVTPTIMSANTSVSFSNLKTGARGSITWQQAASGGPFTVTYTGTVANMCQVSPTASILTTQLWHTDGTTVTGDGCTTNEGTLFRAPEVAAPGTPVTSSGVGWFDSTNHVLSVKDNSSTVSNTVVPATCTSQFISAISAAGVTTCATVTPTTATGNTTGSGNFVLATSPTLVTPALGTPTALVLTSATGLPTAGLVNNAVTSAKMAVANTYRTCDVPVGDTSASALTNAQLGPQSRICFMPAAATIIEMDVNADAGTPTVIVGRNRAGTIVNIVSSALATAASGGIACSNTGGTTGLNGATTCSSTLQNTSLNAGDYLELVSGTAGGTAKFFVVHVTYTVN